MKFRVLAIACALALALAATGCAASTGTTAAPDDALENTITAQGTGEAWAAPDIAQVSFGVTKQAEKADVALAQASEVASAIVDAVKASGVEEKDIQTQWVNLEPRQTQEEGEAPVIVGYNAMVMVQVKIRDIESVGDVIEGASNAGVTDVSGLSFALDDDAAAQDEAITTAVDDARARAEAMAAASDRVLGDVIQVSESAVYTPMFSPNYAAPAYAMDGGYRAAIEPGQIQMTTNVTVVFELQ